MTPFQKILVPVDFGEAMQPALDLAIAVARRFDSDLTLVHAFDLAPFTSMTPFEPIIDIEPLVVAAEGELKKVLTKVRASWPKTECELRRGAPYEVILAVARAHASDLIVVGSHGRRGIARVLLGSVAERVVRLSPVPVLTVHPPAAAGATATAA
jgi:nucleotide-binding universal stress UspA family protein